MTPHEILSEDHMKKALYTTTALAAAGLVSLASFDAFAQAAAPAPAQKMQVAIGGFMSQTVGYVSQTGTASGLSYKHFDQKADSEIYFTGSINLDNGLTVALNIQLETEPENTSNTDESYLTIGSADVGTMYLGATNSAAFYLGVAAPGAGVPTFDGTLASWIVAPSTAGYRVPSTAGSTTNTGATDYNRVEYISPSILGFRVGGGYAPSSTASQTQPTVAEGDFTNAAIQWSGAVGDFKPRAYAGWWRVSEAHTTTNDNYSLGADVTFADWTLGGGYLTSIHRYNDFATTTSQPSGQNWNAGIKYNPGPFAVALTYAGGKADDTDAVPKSDRLSKFVLGGEYILGPGVTLLGDVARIVYTDENNAGQASENNGWAVISGVKVDF